MNDTLKVIASRFSCRNFKEVQPNIEDLNAIANAAIQAPSGRNRQHWHIIVVKNRDLINDMDREGIEVLSTMEDKTMYERIMSRGGKLFYNAPAMIIIAIKEALPKGAELIDCGIIAQNISLAATSLGIDNLHCGLAGLSFAGKKATEFKTKLQFPNGYEYGIGILLGYATEPGIPHEPDPSKITIIE